VEATSPVTVGPNYVGDKRNSLKEGRRRGGGKIGGLWKGIKSGRGSPPLIREGETGVCDRGARKWGKK